MNAIAAALDIVPGWIYALVIAAFAAMLAVSSVRTLDAKTELAEARLESQRLKTAHADALAKAEASARAREQELVRENERVANEHAQRQAASAARIAAAARVAASLRDRIAALSARPTPQDPVAADFDREARVARELLGACADEYQRMAAAADELRDTAAGLQAWAAAVTQGQATDGSR